MPARPAAQGAWLSLRHLAQQTHAPSPCSPSTSVFDVCIGANRPEREGGQVEDTEFEL